MHTELELPVRKCLDWGGMKKEKEKKSMEKKPPGWLHKGGQRSVPWGCVSLTPPPNEIDPLSEITSCQCLQGGKNLGNGVAQQERRNWTLCERLAIQSLNKRSKFGCYCTNNSSWLDCEHLLSLQILWSDFRASVNVSIVQALSCSGSVFRLDGAVWNMISVR